MSSEKIKVLWKYLISFTKRAWQIGDYPLRFRHQLPERDDNINPKLKMIPWMVQIVNWPQMAGCGSSKDEAYQDLKRKFKERMEKGLELPRPGTGLPIEFAPTEGVDKYADLASDFMRKILEYEAEQPFVITDESSLWDFHMEESNSIYFERIKSEYCVDVSGIKNGNLLEIFRRIEQGNN